MRLHALALACCLISPLATAAPLQLMLGGQSIDLDAPQGWSRLQVTLIAPSGEVVERVYAAQGNSRLDLGLKSPADGAWRYSLRFEGEPRTAPVSGSDSLDGRRGGPGRAWPVLSGGFGLAEGGLVRSDVPEQHKADGAATAKAQLITGDLAVNDSICVGFDCVAAETFGADTLRLKENNLRIHFDDTSASGSFPNHDWGLIANDQENGGLNRFSLENRTTGTLPFTVVGGAPNNAIWVDAQGRIGFRNSTPVVDLHPQTTNTPTLRLDQSNAGGFTAQVWDLAGNEANFFVRDVTNGSLLPFRIRPSAPTSSIDIGASGNVGFGGANALAKVEAIHNTPANSPQLALQVRNINAEFAGVQDRFSVDSNGNVTARGTISQLSSRATKENFQPLDGPLLLAKLEKLEVPAWNYRESTAEERHIGPVAEEFHDTFGVGADPRFLAPGDVAGVALASVKALQEEVKQRDARIAELEARLQRLEALLPAAN
jgi:hypothetical protein